MTVRLNVLTCSDGQFNDDRLKSSVSHVALHVWIMAKEDH